MKRRGFLGALLGLPAAVAAVARAEGKVPEVVAEPVVKVSQGDVDYSGLDLSEECMTTFGRYTLFTATAGTLSGLGSRGIGIRHTF
jgi:hypothetical protein